MDTETDLDVVALAKTHLEEDHYLALFMVRDLRITKNMGLDDLAWAMHKGGCARSEVAWLLNELEEGQFDKSTECLPGPH